MIRLAAPRFTLSLFLAPALLATAVPARAASFAVNTTADTIDALPGDGICADAVGDCSLRAAVMETNALTGNDEVVLPAGLYLLEGGCPQPDLEATGDLDITDGLLIRGAGSDQTIVDGQEQTRVFETALLPGAQPVELRDLTIRNGYGLACGGGAGGIANQAVLTLQRVRVESNRSEASPGGGIFSTSNPLYAFDSTFHDNEATNNSGGAISVTSSTVELHRSTVSDNRANGAAGIAVGTGAVLVAVDSTFVGNVASAANGGAISVAPTSIQTILRSSTIVGNSAVFGGGLFRSNGPTVFVANSILADNTASGQGPDCYAATALSSAGYNLIESTANCLIGGTTTGNLHGVAPDLLPLGAYGGLTLTRPPALTSPTVDAAHPAVPGGGETWACAAADQRGAARPRDGDGDATARCDIGAVELGRHDFGDAPDPDFPTLAASDGARHLMAGTLGLGVRRDDDGDGQPNYAGAGDDAGDTDDEDGVEFPPLLAGSSADLTVTASEPGLLDAWVDFDQDGVWSEGDERVAAGVALVAGANSLSIDIPAAAPVGFAHARFRLSTAGTLTPQGEAADGEVEDYRVYIGELVFEASFEAGGLAVWDVVVP